MKETKMPAAKTSPPPTNTPWGEPQQIEDLGQGLYFISTAGHGGLHIGVPIQKRLPRRVGQLLLNGTQWAEQDCETPIVLTILAPYLDPNNIIKLNQPGQSAEERIKIERATAIKMTETHERYAPCRRYLD